MRTIMNKFFLLVLVSVSMLSCNEGIEGFNAEAGSTINMPGGRTVTGTTSVALRINVTSSRGVPANGVQIQLFCVDCTILDDPDGNGGTITSENIGNYVEVATPYIIRTGRDGSYQLLVAVEDPANLGVASYTARLQGDIGVSFGETTIAVQ